jgi:phosphonate transport system substrate-binding protein
MRCLHLLTLVSCDRSGQPAPVNRISVESETLSLVFGIYAADRPSQVVAQFKPLLMQLELSLEEQLDREVEIKIDVASSYEEGIQRVVLEKNDFSRLGPASYVMAKEMNDTLSVLAMESNKGSKTFNGVIAVHQDSEIKTLSDLKGRSFAFGDERSTIGRYLSQQLLAKNGVKSSDLKQFEYLKRHDAVGAAVGARRFDAGALKESTFKKLKTKGTPLRILTTFKNVTKPWVVNKRCDPDVVEALRKALLSMKDEAALKALGKQGFLSGEDKDYDWIRTSINNNRKFFDR